MATIKQFEDLICWQRARELTKFVYDISKYQHFERDKGLQDQIRRAAVSVMSNVAEGFDRGTKQEFLNYLFIAKGSCGEVRCQLHVAYDAEYIDMSKFRYGMQLCDEVSRLLASFIQKLKVGGREGMQYRREETKTARERREFDEYFAWYLQEKERSPELQMSEAGLEEFVRKRSRQAIQKVSVISKF